MKEVLRTNDPVALSLAQSLLKDSQIQCFVLDEQTAAIEGSIGAIRRRIMVADEDAAAARQLMSDAELIDGPG